MAFGIGIDTGGTFTDAVVINLDDKKPVAWDKTPTTHYDLGVCINLIILKILEKSGISPEYIKNISISTTLATNAVVEGKGAKVGLFMIGLTSFLNLPVVDTIYIQGGHKWTGEEENPLNLEGLSVAIEEIKDKAEGYAVVSNMSFVNPTHELVTAEAIRLLDPKPVVLSHQLTTRAGLKERAATVVFNARLTPIMANFLEKISLQLNNLGINANISVIKGNGKPMNIDEALMRPVDTVSSGPAASAIYGGEFLKSSNIKNAIVVDIGGTTTDISVIIDGSPMLNETGSLINKWRTHTSALETFTIGVGGDSYVRLYNKIITIGPNRVKPLSQVKWQGFSEFLKKFNISECYTLNTEQGFNGLVDNTDNNWNVFSNFVDANQYFTKEQLYNSLNIEKIAIERIFNRLMANQIISLCAFTPTDALHFLDKINLGNRENSVTGLINLSKKSELDPTTLCNEILLNVKEMITAGIIEYLIKLQLNEFPANLISGLKKNKYLDINFILKFQIVGLGAASPYLLDDVDKILGAKIIFPEFYEIGNALGAALAGMDG